VIRRGFGSVLLAWLWANALPSDLLADTLTGGVTLVGGSMISSTADTTVLNGGQIKWLAWISMEHRILDAVTAFSHAFETASGMGQITNFVNTPKVPETCYLGENISTSGSLWSAWHSSNIVCVPPPPCNNTPILLDLALDGYNLSAPEPPVAFDLDADGAAELGAWTSRRSDDGFLCMDRNSNKRIDDGSELFGNATPLLSGEPARVGFRALAELDLPELGGDRNGMIDSSDAAFQQLCVWTDRNRDGTSQREEILMLSGTRILALELEYSAVDLYDEHDNIFWLQGAMHVIDRAGRPRRWPIYDVIFSEAGTLQPSSPELCDD